MSRNIIVHNIRFLKKMVHFFLPETEAKRQNVCRLFV